MYLLYRLYVFDFEWHFGVCTTFFLFKQTTAYDVRISDWSSDVCSSDLVVFVDPARDVMVAGDLVLPRITPSIGFEQAPATLPLGDYLRSLRLVREIGRALCRERVCPHV